MYEPKVALVDQMFSGMSADQQIIRFEKYKDGLQKSISDADAGAYRLADIPGSSAEQGGQVLVRQRKTGLADMDAMMERLSAFQKEAGDTASKDVQAALEMLGEFTKDEQFRKDWTVTTGYTGTSANPAGQPIPYDLQHPLKELVPLHTPLLNEMPIEDQGIGTATHWKQLDSLQGSGVGSLALGIDPFFSSQTDTNTFGSLALRRGAKINYVTSDHTAQYVEWGLSDLVADVAQYAGQGFQNVRQLSQHALAWTHLMAKERAVLYGRGGTGGGYVGTVGTPSGVTAVGAAGGTIANGTYLFIVTFVGHFGESASAEVSTGAIANGGANKITVSWTAPAASAGVAYVNVYGTGGASGTEKFQTKVVGNTSVVFTAPLATGTAAAPAASSDTSFSNKGFDGLIPNIAANGGYVNQQTAGVKWASDATVGNELQAAFLSMWLNNFATPGEIWMDASIKVGFGKAIQANGNATPYRIQMSQTDGTIGIVVSGIQNLASPNDDMVAFKVHPFMPTGVVILRSPHLPFPTAGLSSTSALRMVQGLVTIDWPRIQHTFDSSTYEFGTLVHYAPAWNGIFLGVTI